MYIDVKQLKMNKFISDIIPLKKSKFIKSILLLVPQMLHFRYPHYAPANHLVKSHPEGVLNTLCPTDVLKTS